jgi:hypothetical protein
VRFQRICLELQPIDHAKPGLTELRTLAACVEALGGRLEIIVFRAPERFALSSG